MKKAIRIGITIVLCAGLVVGYYYYLSQKNEKPVQQTEVTEVDKIIGRDFDSKYPASPREVVKWYNRIITAYYGQEYTPEQLEQMARQAQKLMDEELLQYNDEQTYLRQLKADIEDYKNRKKEIVQSRVDDSNSIRYATIKGRECCYIQAHYFSKEGSDYSRTHQEFVLRKDEDGNWKILSFRLIEGETDES